MTVRDELMAKARRYLIKTSSKNELVTAEEGPIIARAEGSICWDTEGNPYIDFNSGQMCSALGHNHPDIVAVIQSQSRVLTHAALAFYNEPQVEFAERLASISDANLQKTIFTLSGSDANELAILFARRATKRNAIGALTQAYHGATSSTRAISYSAAAPGYGPAEPEVFAMPTPYCFRCPHKTEVGCCLAPLYYGMETLDKQSAGQLAAVVIEPLISAGGVIDVPAEYIQSLKSELEKRGALLIFDEAQTGLGKLGTMFGYQQKGVVPDLVTLSKHLGGGLPVSAVLTSDAIAAAATTNGLPYAHSHDADPLGCRAGIESINVIVKNDLPRRAREIGERWRSNMETLQQRYEMIGDIRGKGLLQGLELVKDRKSKTPAPAEAAAIYRHSLSHGLLFSVRGLYKNVLRFVPPFSTTEHEVDRAAEILEDGIRASLGLKAGSPHN